MPMARAACHFRAVELDVLSRASARVPLRACRASVRPTVQPVSRPYTTQGGAVRTAVMTQARPRSVANVGLMAGGSALLAGAYSWAMGPAECEAVVDRFASGGRVPAMEAKTPEDAKSIVNLYQLSFGTVCGLCAGVFIKKGFKLIATVLGAGFVMLQYLASKRVLKINWSSMESAYKSGLDSLAGASERNGVRSSSPPLVRIWNNLVNFLTANFQQRATFAAGLVLGLRLG